MADGVIQDVIDAFSDEIPAWLRGHSGYITDYEIEGAAREAVKRVTEWVADKLSAEYSEQYGRLDKDLHTYDKGYLAGLDRAAYIARSMSDG